MTRSLIIITWVSFSNWDGKKFSTHIPQQQTVYLKILIAICIYLQNTPEWFRQWRKTSQKSRKFSEKSHDDLEAQVRWLEKERRSLQNKYVYAAQHASVATVHAASAVARAVEEKVSRYAYAQGRASFDANRGTVSVPHPELGDIDVPLVEGNNFHESLNVPVTAKDLILQGECDGDQTVILKRKQSLFHAISEYHALTKLQDHQGFPKVLGIHHSYNESFVVTEMVPSDCHYVTLQDALYSEAFECTTTVMWKSILFQLWELMDYIHSIGYIHNNIVCNNVILSVTDKVPSPFLCGFSLFCHPTDAIKVFKMQKPEFAKLIGHFHPDVSNGMMPPCFANDVYCYGKVLQQVHRAFHIFRYDSSSKEDRQFWEKVEWLMTQCLHMNCTKVPYGRELAPIVKHSLL